jgi:hypothetical protein
MLGKAIPVTGREGPEGCETSRLSHFLHYWTTDGGEVTDPEVSGSIPGAYRFSEKQRVWNEVHSTL